LSAMFDKARRTIEKFRGRKMLFKGDGAHARPFQVDIGWDPSLEPALGGSVVIDGRAPIPHQFFGLKSIALTTAATLALCSAIELANSFGPPMLTIWPVVSSRSLMLPSAVTSRTSA